MGSVRFSEILAFHTRRAFRNNFSHSAVLSSTGKESIARSRRTAGIFSCCDFTPIQVAFISNRICYYQGTKALSLFSKVCSSSNSGEAEYERNASLALAYLSEYFDSLPELVDCHESYDVDYSMGVITLKVSPKIGTYVINMQTPNKQIWLSSPISGPKRYDFVDGKWRYLRDGVPLDELLTAEFRKIFNNDSITIKLG